jgi:hypothetical protein
MAPADSVSCRRQILRQVPRGGQFKEQQRANATADNTGKVSGTRCSLLSCRCTSTSHMSASGCERMLTDLTSDGDSNQGQHTARTSPMVDSIKLQAMIHSCLIR